MSTQVETATGGIPEVVSLRRTSPRYGEMVVKALLWLCGVISILTTVGIVAVLVVEGSAFFRSEHVSVVEFFTSTHWFPSRAPTSDSFGVGVLPLVNSTLLITTIAVLVAVPLGLASAIYLSDYAPGWVRRTVKPILEILAGVPTVVLGYFGLTLVTPLLQDLLGQDIIKIFNVGAAGLVVGVMIVPTVASLSEDAMSAVPRALREAAYGLGAPKRTVVRRVVLPAALSGIVGAVILALGRAVGETMIVAIVAGNNPAVGIDPGEGMQAMTAYIVSVFGGEAPRGSLVYQSIFAVGALLFVITFTLNLVARWVSRRYRQAY